MCYEWLVYVVILAGVSKATKKMECLGNAVMLFELFMGLVYHVMLRIFFMVIVKLHLLGSVFFIILLVICVLLL